MGWGRYLKVCSMHAPSHFPYAHSYPQPPASISDSPISHLHPRLPNYSHPRESTCTMVSPAHLPSYSHLQPPSHPASTCTNKERIENPTLNHDTLTVTDRAKRTTRLYLTLPTLPYIPYQPHLGEFSEAFLSSPSPSPSPFPTISPYPITRVNE